ncbi:methylated-DNA--[protein]-cysteine S-methyltransferase [Frigoribacterium sp. CFBP 8754]|uniref:methylated-DNA--[protein]-cysteine S-methyltransferase n=1 Tax=Frigoribacterium sp. CFBP 8754 TaxID=2775290 RepID=UPI00352C8CC8
MTETGSARGAGTTGTGWGTDDPAPTTAPDAAVVHTTTSTPVGLLTVAGGVDGLVGLWFEGHRRGPTRDSLGPRSDVGTGASDFGEVARQLGQYFAGERTAFDLPLAPRGDDFRQRVWAALRTIPHGETRTYGQLAVGLGGVGLARAVGAANALNPLSIVVPCHRVVGAGGALTGYAGGLERKRFLLALEEPAERRESRLF